MLFFPAPCWKFDFAEIKTNRVFERKKERVYKALHLGDTLNLSSTIGKTSEVEDYADLLESIESWNFDEDENINKTALIDVGIGDDHSTTDWPFPRLIRNQNESIFAFKIWPEIST